MFSSKWYLAFFFNFKLRSWFSLIYLTLQIISHFTVYSVISDTRMKVRDQLKRNGALMAAIKAENRADHDRLEQDCERNYIFC